MNQNQQEPEIPQQVLAENDLNISISEDRKENKQILLMNKKYKRENNFLVGAGHAFFLSDQSKENNENNNTSLEPEKQEKIGKKIFLFTNNEVESVSTESKSTQQIEMENRKNLEQTSDISNNSLPDPGNLKLSIITKDQKYPKWFPWVTLVLSILWGAYIPTWILSIPAEKYLRICWRYFMTAFWLIPLLFWEYRQPKYRQFYSRANICNWNHIKNVLISALGSALCFDYTFVSHSILLGNLQNFFLSLLRTYKKGGQKIEMEIVGQVLVLIGIALIIVDSCTLDYIQDKENRQNFIMTDHLSKDIWKKILLGDLICLLTSFLVSKISLVDVEIKNTFPPYLAILSTISMAIASFFIEETSMSNDSVTGWFGLFTSENFFTYLLLSAMCGIGLFVSYMYVGKFFEPIVSASVFLFEPIIATILIYAFGVEMLPGPFACLGYVFQIPGQFLILLTRYIIQQKQKD